MLHELQVQHKLNKVHRERKIKGERKCVRRGGDSESDEPTFLQLLESPPLFQSEIHLRELL